VARLIVSKINAYASDPAGLAENVKMLKGDHAGLVRLRVGDWRIIMDDPRQRPENPGGQASGRRI